MDLLLLMQNHIGLFLLIFARMSGIFSVAPVFGSRNVPTYAKAGLSFTLTAIIFPLLFNANLKIAEQLLPYILAIGSEFLVGLILGFASSFIFWAVQMAGQLLDMQIGFGIVNVFDPQLGQQVPLLGNFNYILALLVFLATNGHHILITALFNSFTLIPVTGVIFQPALTPIIIDMVNGIFVIAVKISLPVLVALFLTDIALGILARTMPQMNIFVVGIPVKIIVGIFVLSIIIPVYIMFLEVCFSGMYRDIYRLLASFNR